VNGLSNETRCKESDGMRPPAGDVDTPIASTCAFETPETPCERHRLAYDSEVGGSNPVPATNGNGTGGLTLSHFVLVGNSGIAIGFAILSPELQPPSIRDRSPRQISGYLL
jgi:hypothetical protein